MPRILPVSRHLPAAMLWAGMCACVAGLAMHRMWSVLPFPRLFEHLLLALLALLAAWPLQRWLHWSRAGALAATWLLALAVFAGPLPLLAVALLAAAAIALGSLVMAGPLALPLGLALIAGGLGWLLPLPIHHRGVYAIACLALVAWRRAAIAASCRVARDELTAAVREAPGAATAAILLLGLASTGAWLPTMQYDDVVYHLGLPSQLQATARYAMDARLQVWALAPWGGDVLQGVAQVLAGREARGALDALWLAIAAGTAFALVAALGGGARRRWWGIALLGSLPLCMSLVGGMQTELPAMALLPLLAWLALRGESASPRLLFAGAIVFGALCELKATHAVVALPLLAWAACRHRKRIPWRCLPVAVLVALAVGGSSYAYAWALAGNPVLPLFNATFRSPYFAFSNFDDPRWHAGFSASLPWGITFDTGRYFEAFAGGFGFVLVAFAGVWLLALHDRRTRALAAVAGLGMLLPLLPLQYARYLQPGLALAIPALVVAYPQVRGATAAFWSLCVLNLAFASNAHWMLRTGALKATIKAGGNDLPVLERYQAGRVLATRIRAGTPATDLVLVLPGTGYALAELGERGRGALWYAPAWQAAAERADADASGVAWARLLHDQRIVHVILAPDALTPAQRMGLQRSHAALVASVSDAQWWRIADNARP